MYLLVNTVSRIVRASYPILWLYTGFLFILGSLIGVKNGGEISVSFIPYVLWFFAGANLFGMLLNDYFDQKIDAHNPRKTGPKLLTYEYALGIGAACISYLGIAVAYPNPEIIAWVLVAVLANVLYSMPPIRLKERPPFDLLIGPTSYLSALFAGYTFTLGWPTPTAALAGILFFCGIDLAFKTLDIEADTRTNVRSSAVLLGRKTALSAAALCIIGAGIGAAFIRPYYMLAILPYLSILYFMKNANDSGSRELLNARLPIWYTVAGFIVTLVYWILV